MIGTVLRVLLLTLLVIGVVLGLVVTIVPRFLDRIYYRGSESDHFDGARFFNPDGEDTAAPPGGGSRGGFLVRYLTGRDGRPPWPEQVKVAQATPAERVEGDRMVATWVGHATVLVQSQGLNILSDPVWSRQAGPFGFGPKRVTAPGVAFEQLPKIDLIVVSHNHYDHMDLATLKRLWDRDRPLIVTSLGNDAILRSKGIEATALDWGGAVTVRGVSSQPKPIRVVVRAITIGAAAGSPTAIAPCGRALSSNCRAAICSSPAIPGSGMAAGLMKRRGLVQSGSR
jgi:hypothetical protein